MKRFHVEVIDDDGKVVCSEWGNATDAIALLQQAIATLRRPHLPQFDASFGEAPMPITGPSREELSRFLNQAQRA